MFLIDRPKPNIVEQRIHGRILFYALGKPQPVRVLLKEQPSNMYQVFDCELGGYAFTGCSFTDILPFYGSRADGYDCVAVMQYEQCKYLTERV